jgi:UDPglucose 6-dehydrogenase
VLDQADALVIVTEWNEFRALALDRVKAAMRRPLVLDLRNVYRPEEMGRAGLVYYSIGRPPVNVPASNGAVLTEGAPALG